MILHDLITASLTLWIITHTVSIEIPITARMRKPISCQLCLSGWIMIGVIMATIVISLAPDQPWDLRYLLEAGAIWAGSVLIEAVHTRLQPYTIL